MNRETWALIKLHKNFNVHVFRQGVSALIISLLLSGLLGVLLFFVYIGQPERHFYATNGISPPEELQAMSAPNMSSKALLENEPPSEDENRNIPQ